AAWRCGTIPPWGGVISWKTPTRALWLWILKVTSCPKNHRFVPSSGGTYISRGRYASIAPALLTKQNKRMIISPVGIPSSCVGVLTPPTERMVAILTIRSHRQNDGAPRRFAPRRDNYLVISGRFTSKHGDGEAPKNSLID